MDIGIYYIKNKANNKYYIGQSQDLQRRKREHQYHLRTNTHVNIYLQNSYNYYGPENFEFGILEYCQKEKLDELEIYYIDKFNAQTEGYNICDGGIQVCPDNSNENHGMWRDDIPNDLLKEYYLQDYNSTQLAEIFGCSRRTINRRLKKILGDDYEKIKKIKQSTGAKSYDHTDQSIKNEDILYYVKQGYNSVEIAKLLNCSDSAVMGRLKKIFSEDEYVNYKKQNNKRKMAKLREKAHTKENIAKSVEKRKKYTLWNGSKIHYNPYKHKNKMKPRFYLRYNTKDVRGIVFIEFISPEIIHELIKEYV